MEYPVGNPRTEGSPPPVRGKDGRPISKALYLRITPACAGKSAADKLGFKDV